MTATNTTIDAHSAVEMILSNRVANEPGFLERVMLDPEGTIAPIIAEVAEDDDLDLSDYRINVHVETPRSMHFVVKTNPDDEVAGFASSFMKMDLGFDVRRPVFGAKAGGTVGNNTTTHTACHTNVCKSKAEGSCPAQEFKMA